MENEETRTAPIGISLFVFAFGVSIDSFSVGLSLGIYGAQTIITILLFGFVSMLLAWIGLFIGRHAKDMLGTYGEIVGGIILVGFGLYLLFLYNFRGGRYEQVIGMVYSICNFFRDGYDCLLFGVLFYKFQF